jgi:decaprenylphospho-beta-D-erythro-pentofuranosid-2-ulose 2-reductase
LDPILFLGAKSDIAKATAKVYAENGYDLYLAGRNVKIELMDFSIEISQKYDCQVDLFELDILEFESHLLFFELLPHKPKGVLCFIGYLGNQKNSESELLETKKIIDINFTGIISLLNIFANYFEKIESGFIVGISSVAGERGRKSNYIYGSAKAGLTNYLSGLRNRLADKNINVLTIIPGFVDTNMTKEIELPPLLTSTPESVARHIFKSQQNRKNIIYTKKIWRWIMLILKAIPERQFKKMSL